MATGVEENWPVPMRAIGAQNLLTMPGGVTQSGYLHKKGGSQWKIMKWPLRFVIIHKGCIYYFKSSTAASPQGAFSLNGYNRVMRSTEETTSSNVFPFKIIHINKKHRTWYFSAACEEERKNWMMGLRKEIDRYHEKADVQGNLSDYSDAEKFYGSIERPVQIKYTARELESGDYADDDEEEEEEEEEEDDYLRPDGLSVSLKSEGVHPMLNSPIQLERNNKKPLPPLPPPTQRRMSHGLVVIKEDLSSSLQDRLPSPSATKTEVSALLKCLSPKASPGCPTPPSVHLKSASGGKEQHWRYSETTDSDVKVKSKFAMELNKHLQQTTGKETSLDVVSPSVLFYKGPNSGPPSTSTNKASSTVPPSVPINKGTNIIPPPVPINKGTNIIPPPVPINKGTNIIPPPVPINKGTNIIPPMNKGACIVPSPVPMNKGASTVPPPVPMNKGVSTISPPVPIDKGASTVPPPVPMNKGASAVPPSVPVNKGPKAGYTIFMSKEPSTESPSILMTKGCNAGSPPVPMSKGSNASHPPLPTNKPILSPIPSEPVQVKPKLYKPELLPKGTSALTKQPPPVKPKFQQYGTHLAKPLHRSSPEGRSFRSAETEKPVPRQRSQSQPSQSHISEYDDDDADYENVQLPPSVFVNTTESNDVERLFISTNPRSNPENGLYCIRNSSKSGQVLVVWDDSEKKVRNYRIFEKESKFFLESDVKFICLASMIEFYHKHTLPIHDNLRLRVPYGYKHPS
ncbi:SH3 domain-binding protein 2 isoform X2 [Rhincodon typus]|nr:SH3 domain-binding protein 2 isoform X2 [Rhincodon typus]